MKHSIFITLAIALVIAACATTTEPGPVAEAIGVRVRQDTKVPVHIESATKIDSTTIGKEISRRRGIQELKIWQDSSFRQKYLSQGLVVNARRKAESIGKARAIIAGLDSIHQSLAADTARIAYYDYEFSYCTADAKGNKTEPKTGYATVTPNREVVTWSIDKKEIHKASGLAIPGYRKLLESLRDE